MTNEKLKEGEMYLNVNILGSINVGAFKNKEKKEGDNLPDYQGNGIRIWKNYKKAEKKPQEEDI